MLDKCTVIGGQVRPDWDLSWGNALLAIAHSWEARAVSGVGFAIEFDPTWLDAARELRALVGAMVLLGWVGRQSRTSRARR